MIDARLERLKDTIRKAWVTLSLLPDPDARFRRRLGGGWIFPVVQQASDAYGASPASALGTPTPHEISEMEEVFGWLSWLRNLEGEFSIKRILTWARGEPIWMMAQRERCSAATIHNRINRSVAKILAQFYGDRLDIAVVDEPEVHPDRMRSFAPPPSSGTNEILTEPGKVFISGIGMMFRGEKYVPAQEAPENMGKRRR
jgi:hypothetical protein